MQAVILAAGKGARLGELTESNTKCMISVNDKTLIEHTLEKIERSGIEKVVLVVGYQKDNLINYIQSKKWNLNIEYVVNEDYETTNNIYSLFLAAKNLEDDDTIIFESDILFDENILKDLLADDRKNLVAVDKYQSWMDGTVVKINDSNAITSFVPKEFFDYNEVDSYYKTVNIYKFSKEFSAGIYVPFLKAYSQALGTNGYYEQVLRVILTLENCNLEPFIVNDRKWYEIDDIQDLRIAEAIFEECPSKKLKLFESRYGGYWRYPKVIDYCYLVNPYFPPQKFIDEISHSFKTLFSEYPSGLKTQNHLAAKLFGIRESQITVGNGASEIIKILPEVLKGKIGMIFPSFNEYLEVFTEDRVEKLLPNNKNFSYNTQDLLQLAERCENILLINPDNPSGHFIPKEDLITLLDKLSSKGKNLVLDESFVDFSDKGEENTLITPSILEKYPNLLVIKSISKSYGVAGARLGVLACSDQKIISEVNKKLPIWNINSFGEYFLQIIGKYQKDYRNGCKSLTDERNWFYKELNKIPFLRVIPSQSNYFLCEVESNWSSTKLVEKLLFDKEIFSKDLKGKIGLSEGQYIRLAIKSRKENEFLLNNLRDLASDKVLITPAKRAI